MNTNINNLNNDYNDNNSNDNSNNNNSNNNIYIDKNNDNNGNDNNRDNVKDDISIEKNLRKDKNLRKEKNGIFEFDPFFYKSLIAIAIPIIIQNLISSMLNMIDNVMVGGLGNESLAAVGIANQIFFIFALVLFGTNASLSIFIAQYWGKKSGRDIRQAIGLGLIFSFIFSILFMGAIFSVPEIFIGIFTTDKAVIKLGVDYIVIVAIGYPLTAISMVYSVGLRSIEKAAFPLVSSASSLVVNTVLNYVLIYGKFGFPMLGVKGAAIATVIARVLECVLIIGLVYRKDLAVACRLKDIFSLKRKFVFSIIRVAIPIIANESLWVLGTSAFAVVYGRMGTNEIAAFNILQTLDRISFVITLGLGSACAVLIGKKIGEGRNDKAYIYGARSIIIAPIVGVIIGVILFVTRNSVVSLYDVSPVVKEFARTIIILSACMMVVKSINFTNLMGVLRAGGDAHFVLVLEAIPLWFISVPLAIYTGLFLHWPLPYVFLVAQAEEIIKGTLGLFRFFTKKWIHNLVSHQNDLSIEELAVMQ